MGEIEKTYGVVDIDDHGLKQHDIKVSTVVFMIFCLVAAGCYGIEEMIPESGPGLTLVMLMVIPFIWGLPFGLVASELGSVRPQEGGYYKWVQEAFGEFWGFQACWWRTISVYIDNTLYVILAGSYLAAQWNLDWGWEMGFKVLMIAVFTYINVRGVKDVGIVSTVLSILVIVAFGMVAICGFLNWDANPFIPFTAHGEIEGIAGIEFTDWVYFIGMGIAIGVWMYSGYESMSTFAGEVKNPQVIPKATLITVPLIMCVYIFPTMAGLASIGEWEDWGTEPGSVGYATVPTEFWGPAFGIFFAIVAVLANCSIYNTYITSGSRGFFALADDHLAPKMLVKCDKKHGVPYISVLSVGIVNVILCQFDFRTVIIVDVFMLVTSYVMVYLAALKLRKQIPDEEYKFKIPGGYGFLTLICVVPMIIALFVYYVNGLDFFMGGMIGIVSGPVLYVIWKKMYGGLAKKDAERFPINPKTGLGIGDMKRIAGVFLIFTIIGAIALPWVNWFEGDWGPNYYDDPEAVMEEWEVDDIDELKVVYYEEMDIDMDEGYFGKNEDLFFTLNEDGEIFMPGYYAEEYGSMPVLSDFELMKTIVLVVTILFAVLAVVFAVVANKVEPKKA